MSDSATEVDDDATMTRDSGASRTFRSIFGGHASQDGGGTDELKLQRFARDSDRQGDDTNGYRDGTVDGDEDEDDDDGVWGDDAAPQEHRDNNNGDDDQAASASAAAAAQEHEEEEEEEEVDWGSSDASAPRLEELKIPHRRSMEEWADDDDEEDAWKDMLQAKVNQLELVIQSNNEASAGSQLAPSAAAAIAQVEFAHVDSRIALATATHTASLRTTTASERPSRNKIQRLTSGGHSQASGEHNHHRHVAVAISGGAHASQALAVSSPSNYLCKRSGSRDFASNRAAKPTDSKKSAKVASSSRRESLTRSSSASSISATVTRSSTVAQRKNSLDACNTGAQSRTRTANGAVDSTLRGGGLPAAAATAAEPLRPISEVEAVRRFILQDIKQASMSMDRLVADARRLCFLEDFHARRTQSDEAS